MEKIIFYWLYPYVVFLIYFILGIKTHVLHAYIETVRSMLNMTACTATPPVGIACAWPCDPMLSLRKKCA